MTPNKKQLFYDTLNKDLMVLNKYGYMDYNYNNDYDYVFIELNNENMYLMIKYLLNLYYKIYNIDYLLVTIIDNKVIHQDYTNNIRKDKLY